VCGCVYSPRITQTSQCPSPSTTFSLCCCTCPPTKLGCEHFMQGHILRQWAGEALRASSPPLVLKYVTLDNKIKCLSLAAFSFRNPTNKTVHRTAYMWELLIANHLDQSLWSTNQKYWAAVRSNSLHSFLEVHNCVAPFTTDSKVQWMWIRCRKNQFQKKSISWCKLAHFDLFDNEFYCLESHTEHRWRCCKPSKAKQATPSIMGSHVACSITLKLVHFGWIMRYHNNLVGGCSILWMAPLILGQHKGSTCGYIGQLCFGVSHQTSMRPTRTHLAWLY